MEDEEHLECAPRQPPTSEHTIFIDAQCQNYSQPVSQSFGQPQESARRGGGEKRQYINNIQLIKFIYPGVIGPRAEIGKHSPTDATTDEWMMEMRNRIPLFE